jgi:hypothetical protein
MTNWDNGDSADAQILEQEQLQEFLQPRLDRAAQAYNQALKSLWLGNAGAALAMMSFIGAIGRGNPISHTFFLPLGFFIIGLISMGVGELTTLVSEGSAIRRIQRATSIIEISFRDVETPAEQIGLHFSARTLWALASGSCFIVGAIIGFFSLYFAS